MSPVLIGLLGTALAFGAGTWYGTGLGEDKEFAKRAREDSIVQKAGEAAQLAAAGEISKIKTRSTVIRQQTEREIRENTRYIDCRLTDGVFSHINEALTGRAQPAGAGGVPRASTID
jgi:hypothetical protein